MKGEQKLNLQIPDLKLKLSCAKGRRKRWKNRWMNCSAFILDWKVSIGWQLGASNVGPTNSACAVDWRAGVLSGAINMEIPDEVLELADHIIRYET